MARNEALSAEIERLKASFPGADPNKVAALEGLFEQAAHERIFLKQLNAQALKSGLIKIHPENAMLQRPLPISGEIARHSAALTNITDKLCKHLAVAEMEEDDGLAEFE